MQPKIIKFPILAAVLLFLIKCTPIAMEAPFAGDINKREQFVETTVIGTTTYSEIVSRWGNPVSGTSVSTGPNAGGKLWVWSGGVRPTWGRVIVTFDQNGVAQSVESGRYINLNEAVPDDFSGNSPAQAPQASGNAGSGAVNAQLYRQMSAFAATRPSEQAFFARFGNPLNAGSFGLVENMSNSISADGPAASKTHWYGWAPRQMAAAFFNNSMCDGDPHYVAVSAVNGTVTSAATNIPGYGIC